MFEIKYGIEGAIARGGLDFVLESAKGVFELAEEAKVVSGIDRAKDTLDRLEKLKKWEEPGVDELKITKTGETVNGASKSGTKTGAGEYTTPSGGGGVTSTIKANGQTVKFGHGGRHLEGTGLNVDAVNQALANEVSTLDLGTGQFHKGQIYRRRDYYRVYFLWCV